MSDVIYFSNVRLSFPHLAQPQEQINEVTGAKRISYNGELIMPADHPGFVQFMQQYNALALAKWKEHAPAVLQMILADRKSRCFGRGEEKIDKKKFAPYDGYVGNVYVTIGKDTPPQMIQDNGQPIDPANSMAYQQLARKMYGGCYVNAAVKPWVQENKHGNGIRCDLVALQFAKDGEAFGEGNVDASGMFAAVTGAVPSFMQPAAAQMPAAPFGGAPVGLPSFLGGR
jgi:hypothetical protein